MDLESGASCEIPGGSDSSRLQPGESDDNSQVIALRDDVLRTLPECREVQLADCRTSLAGTLLDSVLRLLSPLM